MNIDVAISSALIGCEEARATIWPLNSCSSPRILRQIITSPPTSSLGRRRPRNNLTHPLVLLLVTAPLLIQPTLTTAYLGPTHCTKPRTSATSVLQSVSKGYSSFNHLLFDLTSLATSFKHGQTIPTERLTFKICSGAVIDLDETSLPLGYLPVSVPRVTIQCGDNGLRSNSCTIRGGGKYNPASDVWNNAPERKDSMAGIVGGGKDSVAQIYVYGEDAYEVTLRGLTFDNQPTMEEIDRYQQYTNEFGADFLKDDIITTPNINNNNNGENIEEELLSSNSTGGDKVSFSTQNTASPPSPSTSSRENVELKDKSNRDGQERRNILQEDVSSFSAAYRFAAVAVRGNGYGDDAGPRIITIEDCRFQWHRGYAIIVSPGIQLPTLPRVPASAFTNQTNNFRSKTLDNDDKKRRNLNLLDNGANYIPSDGKVSYFDNTATVNYLDSRRVKISKTEFVNNTAALNNVAGLITSAYSLTMTDCFFQSNEAKAMVFAYNNEALVKNAVFTENKVEVATIILTSPEGSKQISSHPTHLIEQTCFLGSSVGMSNVLLTDVETTGFGQRDNHAAGTQFSWASNCQGAVAEENGSECLKGGNCDGSCVTFESVKCQADLTNAHSGASSSEFAWPFVLSIGSFAIMGILS